MKDVIEAVERIRTLPGANVDANFRQGRAKVLQQLILAEENEEFVDSFMKRSQDSIEKLIQRAKPYTIPDDYIFFLEYYGGLRIERDEYYFSTLGTGPLTEVEYGYILGDDAFHNPGEVGLLSVGELNFRIRPQSYHSFHYKPLFDFNLDLAGIVQEHCVLGIGPGDGRGLLPGEVFKNKVATPGLWRKLSNSFTEWLRYVAETGGACGYL